MIDAQVLKHIIKFNFQNQLKVPLHGTNFNYKTY